MIKSINTPAAVSDKFVAKYGKLWAELDFVVADKISVDLFKEDPMNTDIGYLSLNNRTIKFKYKDLLTYAKSIEELANTVYTSNASKTDVFDVSVRGESFSLRKHEISKLASTLSDACTAVARGYELGLYL
jgi:hypothetical protein